MRGRTYGRTKEVDLTPQGDSEVDVFVALLITLFVVGLIVGFFYLLTHPCTTSCLI